VGDRAVLVLRVPQVEQPFPQEAADVVVERRGGREDLRVAGPAEAFVALRAVGRHREEVAALAPDDVLLQLGEALVGVAVLADLLHRRVRDAGGDVLQAQLSRVIDDLAEPEAVHGEPRLERLTGRVAAEDVLVGGAGATQRFDVELAVVVEDLGVPEQHPVSGVAAELDPHPADEVLAEVDEDAAVLAYVQRFGGDLVLDSDRRCDARLERTVARSVNPGLRPAAGVEAGLVPTVRLVAGVDDLAVL
jgi:hypothetical protein